MASFSLWLNVFELANGANFTSAVLWPKSIATMHKLTSEKPQMGVFLAVAFVFYFFLFFSSISEEFTCEFFVSLHRCCCYICLTLYSHKALGYSVCCSLLKHSEFIRSGFLFTDLIDSFLSFGFLFFVNSSHEVKRIFYSFASDFFRVNFSICGYIIVVAYSQQQFQLIIFWCFQPLSPHILMLYHLLYLISIRYLH